METINVGEKNVYVNRILENYIKLMREDEEHIASVNVMIADAMVGLYYARQDLEGNERVLRLLGEAESVVTELHFLIEQMKDEGKK